MLQSGMPLHGGEAANVNSRGDPCGYPVELILTTISTREAIPSSYLYYYYYGHRRDYIS